MFFWVLFATIFEAASARPPDPRNRDKRNVVSLYCALLHLLQHAFCICGLAGKVHGGSHCSYSRLELYMPSLGKVKILSQYPQIAWGGCLGVRRCHTASVFDMNYYPINVSLKIAKITMNIAEDLDTHRKSMRNQ